MLSWMSHGVELAIRSVALPLVLGCRWLADHGGEAVADADTLTHGWTRRLKTAADELFFASELLAGGPSAFLDVARLRAEVRESLAFFGARGWLDDPAAYHADPPPLREVVIDNLMTRREPYQHLRFESGYAPAASEPGRERWLANVPNRTAHAWLLRHPGRARPWVVCAAAYRMGDPSVDFIGFRARWLHRALGVNIAIPVVPLHGPRRAGRRGGDGFLSGDFVDTVHAVAQAVWDTRRLIDWLRHEGAPGIAVYGLSLGGCTSALLASLESSLDCVVVGIPAVDFGELIRWNLGGPLVRATERLGFPWDDVATLLRVISPLAIVPRIARHRRFVFAAAGDTLAPPSQARALWRHWDEPRLRLYDGSHVSFLFEDSVRELLVEALATTGVLPARGDTL